MCTVDQHTCTPRIQTFNNVWLKTTVPSLNRVRNNTAARVQHCNSRYNIWQLLWIFHGSGALPNQGHLQATAVNNRQRTWSQSTGGFSTTLSKHTHTNHNGSASRWGDNSLGSNTQTQTETSNIWWQLCHIRRMEIQVHSIHGPTGPILSKDVQAGRSSNTTSDRGTPTTSSHNTGRSRSMGPTGPKPQVRVNQRDNRSSSHSLQTTSTWNWTWGTQTTQHKVFTAGRNKEYRIPHKASEANIRQQQLWRVILQLGVWAQQVWKRQQHTTTRSSQDCGLDEWNQRTTTTTPSLDGWSNTNLHRHQSNNHGVLQDNNSIQQTPATGIIQCCNKLQWRSCTDGHRSRQQGQRKRKEQKQRKERKE